MPRKSVYFPDEQWPRIVRAAASEDRSVSKWLQRAANRAIESQADDDAELSGAAHARRIGAAITQEEAEALGIDAPLPEKWR